ncbi:MAG TPA: hypothetical protein PK127_08085 [Clostridiales bacterium]|nr:hypothetical protein [Clostridiales bacterium]HPV02415.1 hypothetical protein [Clostridiales bacterium]
MDRIIKGVQGSGACWLGGSKWNWKSVIRVSVSSYKTTYEDIDMSVKEIMRIAESVC